MTEKKNDRDKVEKVDRSTGGGKHTWDSDFPKQPSFEPEPVRDTIPPPQPQEEKKDG
jgi:hypothetical protein